MPIKLERALTPIGVKNAPAGMHCDGGGLYLQVRRAKDGKSLNRSWIFRFRQSDGRLRSMGLGSLSTVGLAEARNKARQLRSTRLDGIDPIEDRRAARAVPPKAMTFDQAATTFIRERENIWRNQKHRAQWWRSLEVYVSPIIGKLPVREIDTTHILKILKPMWNNKPETAKRVRGRIEQILDSAKVIGERDGENPARWRGHLDKLLAAPNKIRKIKHHVALPYAELGLFISELRASKDSTARALELCILTATRTSEVLNARWSEIDLPNATWLIPGERTKSARDHRIPLSPAALAIIKTMSEIREGQYVFAGRKPHEPISNMGFLMLMRRMGRNGLTTHGFRSTFRDWCAEQTNFSREVAEAALAHVLKDKTEAAYQRGDLFEKRRRLMNAWAEFAGRPNKSTSSTVIPIKAS